MSWSPMSTAPVDGTDILVRRLEIRDDGTLDASWHAVACYWLGLWVFPYGKGSEPTQLRFDPAEWQPIFDELPAPKPTEEEEGTDDAVENPQAA
jgi:hypothetical protein